MQMLTFKQFHSHLVQFFIGKESIYFG